AGPNSCDCHRPLPGRRLFLSSLGAAETGPAVADAAVTGTTLQVPRPREGALAVGALRLAGGRRVLRSSEARVDDSSQFQLLLVDLDRVIFADQVDEVRRRSDLDLAVREPHAAPLGVVSALKQMLDHGY